MSEFESEHSIVRTIPAVRPVLPVSDTIASLEYYRTCLDFKESWRFVDRESKDAAERVPSLILVYRGSCEIFLASRDFVVPNEIVIELESREAVDELATRYTKYGVEIAEEPARKPWGSYELHVSDIDGHLLRFASDLPRRP